MKLKDYCKNNRKNYVLVIDSIKFQIDDQIHSFVNDQLPDFHFICNDLIDIRIIDQIWRRVLNKVSNQLGDNFRNQICTQVNEDLKEYETKRL